VAGRHRRARVSTSAIEADLIEELGRIYGYANIPASLSSAPVSVSVRPEAEFSLAVARQLLVDRGYQEAITYSFIAPDAAQALWPCDGPIELANPISADMSVMRASLWPGLVQTLRHNLARQQPRVRVFESGLTFVRAGDEIEQHPKLAGLVYGDVVPEQWAQPVRRADFYDIKADVELLLRQVADPDEFRFEAAEHPALHPGAGGPDHPRRRGDRLDRPAAPAGPEGARRAQGRVCVRDRSGTAAPRVDPGVRPAVEVPRDPP
jgi:phenylalanyl-tRNA synthetase beta chain